MVAQYKDRFFEAIKNSKADYTDIRFEINDCNNVDYRGKELEKINTSKLSGGIVRACVKGGWGIATFDSLDNVENSVQEAYQCAALIDKGKTELAETDKIDMIVPAKMKRDFRGIGLDEKLNLISGYNAIILETDPAIETSSVSYSDLFRTVYFVSSSGSYFMEERPFMTLRFGAVARDGSLVQRTSDSVASSTTFDAMLEQEELVEKTAKRAVNLLKAPSCKGGTYTIILDPLFAGVFAHEAFGHLSEADLIYENEKQRNLMVYGREMGVKGLNIVDDGTLPGLIGSYTLDDEGTPASKTFLIKDGILVGRLHSRETAAKMGEKPTGNCRAEGRGNKPLVRMTNTYIESGNLTFDELISGIDNGIYACGMTGGGTMKEMFTFSSAYCYGINRGKVGELFRGATLTGNVFETLFNIIGFGNDFEMFQKGCCGKGGQGVPVSFGSPHIKIKDVVVGGR